MVLTFNTQVILSVSYRQGRLHRSDKAMFLSGTDNVGAWRLLRNIYSVLRNKLIPTLVPEIMVTHNAFHLLKCLWEGLPPFHMTMQEKMLLLNFRKSLKRQSEIIKKSQFLLIMQYDIKFTIVPYFIEHFRKL